MILFVLLSFVGICQARRYQPDDIVSFGMNHNERSSPVRLTYCDKPLIISWV